VQLGYEQVWCWGWGAGLHEPELVGARTIELDSHERCEVTGGRITCQTTRPDAIRDIVDVEVDHLVLYCPGKWAKKEGKVTCE
jgi:hypothetical protein